MWAEVLERKMQHLQERMRIEEALLLHYYCYLMQSCSPEQVRSKMRQLH